MVLLSILVTLSSINDISFLSYYNHMAANQPAINIIQEQQL